MSARANLVLLDRAGTPVSHTFTPDGDDVNKVHLYSEKSGVPAGNPRYSISLKRSGGKYRPTIQLTVPVVATQDLNGIESPVVVREAHANLNFVFDGLSTEQERSDLVGMLVSSLAASQTQIDDLVTGLSDIY